ncbi:LLM class F420-dependent oxidoreductase [Salinibacterium sp. NK8237]|uniref:LLM class F420-dependent oxidoreductase n=1 Tax=Salinibacterium sp. NK8237 TaxID=2792038 RepID=UPI0018CD1CB9|nr:LLM class F420-dependent oxidoreductase [Salinibacterium sp. NK8237]MBH0129397.1 LLM class F420-dependent oxidoreductase [Salinibacterium sp. NK8237]
MDFRIFTEPQNGASYTDQLLLAQAAEKLGFNGYFRSDHYVTMDDRNGGLPGPTDSWTTLAGLARETSTIRLGTLVSSATFRHPGILAIQVAQVDDMSGGRVELGLGTGWFEREHAAYGIPFPAKRFGMLEEQLDVITGIWATEPGKTFSYEGKHYQLSQSPALPKPVQNPLPIIIGGSGPSRTPALTAKFAAEYNAGFATIAPLKERIARVRNACEHFDRDPATLVLSIAGTTAVGTTEAQIEARATAANGTPADLRLGGFAGTASEVVDKISELQALGFTRVYFQIMDFHDLDQLDFLAREVVPQLD